MQSAPRPGWPFAGQPARAAGSPGLARMRALRTPSQENRVAAARQQRPPLRLEVSLRAGAVMASGRVSKGPTCEGSVGLSCISGPALLDGSTVCPPPCGLTGASVAATARSRFGRSKLCSWSKGRADHGCARQRKPSGSQFPASSNRRGRLSKDSRLPALRRVVRGRLNTTVAFLVDLRSPN